MDGKRKLVNRKNLSWVISALLFIFVLAGCNGDDGGDGDGDGDGEPSAPNELNVEILDASISPPATVTFRLTDADGNPIDRTDVSMNFVLARIEPGQDEYIDYITRINPSVLNPSASPAPQASSESSASNPNNFESLGDGMFKYTFSTPIPDNFNSSATHTVGIYATKTIGSQRFVSNDTFDFIPAGGNVDAVRDIVRTETCNTCHNPLEAHGGARRDVKLCVLCHTSKIADPATGQLVDHIDPGSGNNIGFKIMVHKIHRGKDLPSVQGILVPTPAPYFFEGFDPPPTPSGEDPPPIIVDFSTVGFPQDIRNCTKCHTNQAEQSDEYKNDPSRAACGSCHDNVDFSGNDPNRLKEHIIQTTDNNCSGCHNPSGEEFTQSVTGAHTVPLKSRELAGVNFEILGVRSAETGSDRVEPGEPLEVTFSINTDAGEIINPMDMDFLRLTLAGPTTEYNIQDYNGDGIKTPGDPLSPWTPGAEDYIQEDPRSSAVGPDASGNFAYTFTAKIPNDATGTYAVGIEGYRLATVGGEGKVLIEEVRDAGINVVFYFPVTDDEAIPRRMVVDASNCSACHGVFSEDFSVHGGIRNDIQYCALCHNPSHDTLSRQIPPIGEPTLTNSVDFKVMIHKIHTGEELTKKPYLLFSPPGGIFPDQFERAVDFSEVRFPGDRRDCEACHLPDTYVLEPTQGVLNPNVLPSTQREFTRDVMSKAVNFNIFTTPVISVCTSCHDNLGVSSVSTGGDILINMLTGENHPGGAVPEGTCVGCHREGEFSAVTEKHIPPLPPEDRIVRPQPAE